MTELKETHSDNRFYLIRLLLDDVKRQPALTTRRQELWLGAQINSVKVLLDWKSQFTQKEQQSPSAQETLEWVYSSLVRSWTELEEKALQAEVQLPRPESIITEVMTARHDLFKIRRSRIQRMLNRIERTDTEEMLSLAYDFIEYLWMMPDPALTYILEVFADKEYLPLQEDFKIWLQDRVDLDQQIRSIVLQEKTAKKQLTIGYLRYPARMARNYLGQGVEYLDLVQEGILGALRATERYDYREHGRFVHYVTSWIWQRMNRALTDQGRIIRIPVHFHDLLDDVAEAYCELASDSQGMPDIADVARRVEQVVLSRNQPEDNSEQINGDEEGDVDSDVDSDMVERVRRALSHLWPVHPLNDPVPDYVVHQIDLSLEVSDDGGSLVDFIPSESDTLPAVEVERIDLIERLLEAIELLPFSERDRRMIRLRYGLEDWRERTLEQVGDIFDLSRERVRQIEARALEELAHPRHQKPIIDFHKYRRDEYSLNLPMPLLRYLSRKDHHHLVSKQENMVTEVDIPELDRWLTDLPGGSRFGHEVSIDTREDQLKQVLLSFGSPAHYTDIAEELNEELAHETLDLTYVYSLLARSDETFLPLGRGVFSLLTWERNRAKQAEPVIPFCPLPLTGSDAGAHSFFESILVGCGFLADNPPAEEFLSHIVKWADIDSEPADWLCQGHFTTYYLVGLIPYIFYPDNRDQLLHCKLSEGNIHVIRRYCLENLNRRLEAMPAFWWLLQRHQPIRVTRLGELLADVHPAGLDDASNRLTMLISLGAVAEEYGQYRLTPFGEELAEAWAKRPDIAPQTPMSATTDTDLDDDWVDLGTWL